MSLSWRNMCVLFLTMRLRGYNRLKRRLLTPRVLVPCGSVR